MQKKFLWIAILVLFAQNSFALSKESYDCVRGDGAVTIQFNAYSDDGNNRYLAVEAYWRNDGIFHANNIKVRDGILTAKNFDQSQKYVFDLFKLTMKQSYNGSKGLIANYGKVTEYFCKQKK